MHLRLLTLAITLPIARGLLVYDCDGNGAKFKMISLLGPRRCPDPKRDYSKPKTEVVQLLQQRQEARVTAYQCQAKRTTRVTLVVKFASVVPTRATPAEAAIDCRCHVGA